MNKFDTTLHHRRSIRLKGFDYSQNGLYFITLCCKNHTCLFGKVVPNDQFELNPTLPVKSKNEILIDESTSYLDDYYLKSSDDVLYKPKPGVMELNLAGQKAYQCWKDIPIHFPDVILHEFVIMPNHVHGIIEIKKQQHSINSETGPHTLVHREISLPIDSRPNQIDEHLKKEQKIASFRSPSRTIGSIVRGFKIGVTQWMRQNTSVSDVWQRDYYEIIIRNERAYHLISRYIVNNPSKWFKDKFYHG
jgi:putative transposase